jgi:short-subunit dehydrogenase
MKKAIIIGATSGIGKELAKLLTENGYLVGITGRRIAYRNSKRESKIIPN